MSNYKPYKIVRTDKDNDTYTTYYRTLDHAMVRFELSKSGCKEINLYKYRGSKYRIIQGQSNYC